MQKVKITTVINLFTHFVVKEGVQIVGNVWPATGEAWVVVSPGHKAGSKVLYAVAILRIADALMPCGALGFVGGGAGR